MSPADVLSWTTPIALWAIFLVFNISIIAILSRTLRNVSLKAAVREKSFGPAPTQVASAVPGQTAEPSGDNTSYSRVAGLLGSIVIACFIWALGNVVLVKAFTAPADIASVLTGVGPFILAGSALFAPYAFNQLSQVFK